MTSDTHDIMIIWQILKVITNDRRPGSLLEMLSHLKMSPVADVINSKIVFCLSCPFDILNENKIYQQHRYFLRLFSPAHPLEAEIQV